jgi:hypothetical protein
VLGIASAEGAVEAAPPRVTDCGTCHGCVVWQSSRPTHVFTEQRTRWRLVAFLCVALLHSASCGAQIPAPRALLDLALPEAVPLELVGMLAKLAKETCRSVTGLTAEDAESAEAAASSLAGKADRGPPRNSKGGRAKKREVEVGMRLEARDRQNPRLTCVATIIAVHGTTVTVHFDGWTDRYNYRCPRCTVAALRCRMSGYTATCASSR